MSLGELRKELQDIRAAAKAVRAGEKTRCGDHVASLIRSRRPSSRAPSKMLQVLLIALAMTVEPVAAVVPQDLTTLPVEALLDLTVYSASLFPQKVTQAPSAVTIVTAADIHDYGYRTLADVLKSIRGLYVTYDRNYSYLGVNGFGRPGDYNSRVAVLVDGYRTNDNIYDQGYLGTEFILDVDLIERVEFVPGPSSSIYGSNALFGVINAQSKAWQERGYEALPWS